MKRQRHHATPDHLARFRADAADVVRRLLDTDATVDGIAREYQVGREDVRRAYWTATTPAQREAAGRRKQRDRKPAARVRRDADAIVRRLLAGASIADIVREYGTGTTVVCEVYAARTTKAQRRAAERRCRRRVGSVTGFKPGQEPWNKGMKGIHLHRATEFRPGVIRGNAARRWAAVGTERVRVEDGHRYVWVKVRDDGPTWYRWRPRAHVAWSRAHGRPVPKGWRVVHLDRDTMNDDPGNLRCLSPADALRWQMAEIPGMAEKSRERARRSTLRRHAEAREVIEHKRAAKRAERAGTRVVRSCAGCGFETTSRPAACPKCGGSAWERLRRAVAPAPNPTGLAKFLRELEAVA